MNYLVDANLLCEPTKPQAVRQAVDWFQDHVTECATSSVVIGEVWRGIDDLPQGKKCAGLEVWFDGLRERIHCLDSTFDVALTWGA